MGVRHIRHPDIRVFAPAEDRSRPTTYLLATATNRLRDHLGPRRKASLQAANDYLTGHRGRSIAGLALFLLSRAAR
ncbi:hypothetical protein [Nocardia sp. NBC_01377]|uniref:hypothetical protein n=1 Tax=Nocardia sp. NBC_01377 TaxID=2903595 RepID=UPI0038643E8F